MDCGSPMMGQSTTNRRKDGSKTISKLYICTKKQKINECLWHSISEKDLLEIVSADIQQQLENITINETAVLQKLQCFVSSAGSLSEAKQKLTTLNTRITELETLSSKLYEDRLTGTISLDTFKNLSAKAEEERIQKESERDVLANDIKNANRNLSDINHWMSNIRDYCKLENLDREAILSLVERIEIGKPSCRGKNKQQALTIHYRFVGSVE